MRPIADLLVVVAGVLLWIAYRRRRNPMDLVGAVIGALALAWDLSTWPAVRVDVGWRELALGVVVVAAYFNVVGFPRIFVRTFRVGYRSPEWDFDMRLFDEKARLDRLLLEHRTAEDWTVYRRWQTNALSRGRRILRTLNQLNAPTPEWAAVRDGYVVLYRRILDRVERDEPPDDADTLREGAHLKERAEVLRVAYRTAAMRWMRGANRRS